jgi:hypothetical protein
MDLVFIRAQFEVAVDLQPSPIWPRTLNGPKVSAECAKTAYLSIALRSPSAWPLSHCWDLTLFDLSRDQLVQGEMSVLVNQDRMIMRANGTFALPVGHHETAEALDRRNFWTYFGIFSPDELHEENIVYVSGFEPVITNPVPRVPNEEQSIAYKFTSIETAKSVAGFSTQGSHSKGV